MTIRIIYVFFLIFGLLACQDKSTNPPPPSLPPPPSSSPEKGDNSVQIGDHKKKSADVIQAPNGPAVTKAPETSEGDPPDSTFSYDLSRLSAGGNPQAVMRWNVPEVAKEWKIFLIGKCKLNSCDPIFKIENRVIVDVLKWNPLSKIYKKISSSLYSLDKTETNKGLDFVFKYKGSPIRLESGQDIRLQVLK